MGGFVFAIFLFLVGLAGLLSIKYTKERWPTLVGAALVVLSVVLVLLSCINTVGPRQVGIPVSFGSIGADLQPGVHLLPPWVVVHTCSLGQQQSIMSDSPVTGDLNGHDGVNINGSDQGAAIADVSILYHFDPLRANQLYRKYACNADLIKTNLIRQATRGGVAQAAAKILSVDLRSNRAEIANDALPIINDDFKNDGIVVDNIVLSDIILSAPVQQAADSKLAAQQAAQQAEFNRQKAEKDAQTTAINAQAAAAANAAKTQSLSANVLCQNYIDALREIKPTTILSAGPCGSTSLGNVQIQVPPAGR
ncbi:MAG: SPFH domain-containing protein [Actinomycetota bacterium]|nr:SPFH domain-containing protein [Actinomycetota bacterium]